ncbi:hypothetical protein M5K25_007742 [Dendrobium thyrsiflorum]|uniref:Uncharacterized protein n=1 Tax=Dendrobium thyrsiflorum TaxID=117978 RepID=A0ABD0VM40_DENTH
MASIVVGIPSSSASIANDNPSSSALIAIENPSYSAIRKSSSNFGFFGMAAKKVDALEERLEGEMNQIKETVEERMSSMEGQVADLRDMMKKMLEFQTQSAASHAKGPEAKNTNFEIHREEEEYLYLSPDNGGWTKAVRVVLTSSKEDKKVLLTELQNLEDEQNPIPLRGFRQVIDFIQSSHKTIVSHNCLHDFTFIHEKFLGPLPETVPEFLCSLKLLFSNNLKFLSKLKTGTRAMETIFLKSMEDYANIFNPASLILHEPGDDGETGWRIDTTRRVSTDNILFLWGFGGSTSAVELKHCLLQIHQIFAEDFDVHFVDKTCVVVVFEKSSSAETLLKEMSLVDIVFGVLRDMVVEGLRGSRI